MIHLKPGTPRAWTAFRTRARPEFPRLPESSRAKPTCDIEIAHRSTNTCHLGNIAYKVGRKLEWDTETETIKNDPEATPCSPREPRRGFELPAI